MHEESSVVFDNEEYSPTHRSKPSTFSITRWLIAHSGGYVKDEKQASLILIGFIIVTLILAWIILTMSGPSTVKTFPENVANEPH